MNQAKLLSRPDWRLELQRAYRKPEALLTAVGLDPNEYRADIAARELFPMLVPRHFAQQIETGNPNDPLLRQVLPLGDEFRHVDGYSQDPLQEQNSDTIIDKNQGLLHKYDSRVLIILKGGCAINCRYCFRRHFPYQDVHFSQRELADTLTYLEQNPQVNEVILSGGDPLMATDKQITAIISALDKVDTLKRVRIHSRLPVVIPSRLTDELNSTLASSRLKVSLVLHANHANELSPQLAAGLSTLRSSGVHLFNQSVLLKGVNDAVEVLTDLSEDLFEMDVIPYYLHQLDKVDGAAHFAISDDCAQQLWYALNQRLPGFLVPKLVREIGGEKSKTPIMPDGRTSQSQH